MQGMDAMRNLIVCSGLAIAAGSIGGCTPYATHPRPDGSTQITDARIYPVPTVMTAAIDEMHTKHGQGREIVINLPEDTPASVYADVIKQLGQGRPMQAGDPDVYHIQQVRVRGWTAEVDLIYPVGGGRHESATITMERGMVARYTVVNTRVWRIRVDALPKPNYPAPQDVAGTAIAAELPK